MNDPVLRRGVTHAYPLDRLLAFRAIPAADKLRWLEETVLMLPALLVSESGR